MSNRGYGRRRRRGFSSLLRDFRFERRAGWGFNLYRNTREGKVGGVAAGLADYWDIEPWVVRILWVGLFIFTGTLALWAYLGLWLFMAPRPRRGSADQRASADRYESAFTQEADEADYEEIEVEMEYDEHRHRYRPRKVFRYSDSASVRLQRARDRLDSALRRVEDVESYVTSRRYELNKEFSKL